MELRPAQYAQVPNEAADTLPDLNSIGLLTIMLRHAPGYRFTVADVIKQKSKIPGPKLGKAAAYGAMDTLIAHRWACRVRFMCAKGHWITGLFRTHTRFTDDDFREVCRRFKAGTSIRVRCKGCTKNPEDEVQTIIRPGAKLTWSGSIQAGPEYNKYGHPITELMEPGGLLSTTPAPAPSSGIPELGATSEDDASPQVGPTSGKPTVGGPTVGNPEVFYKTGVEDSSSSGTPEPAPAPRTSTDEDDEEAPQEKPKKRRRQPGAVDLVCEMTDATQDEAAVVLERVKAEAARDGIRIRVLRRYVASFEAEDLTPHLAAIRAQRASEARTEANQATGPDLVCGEHREPMPCEACAGLPLTLIRPLLRRFGPVRRPDLAARTEQTTASVGA